MPTSSRDHLEPVPRDVDVLVVGAGPAGLSAATWLGRYRRRTLLVDGGPPRNHAVEQVHGLLGADPVAPRQLRERALSGLRRYPHVAVRTGRVSAVVAADEGFRADVDDTVVRARRLLLASGVRDVVPDIPGFDVHYGADVFHCPTCEGFEARDRPVVVIGWSVHVPAFATELLDWASSVTIVADGPTEEIDTARRQELAARGIELVEQPAVELEGPRGGLQGVRLGDGRLLRASTAFFSIDHEPDLTLARQLGCELTCEGLVAVDHEGLTSVAGVYAAGDLTPGLQLVPVASAKGVIAGVACARSFHGDRTVAEAPAPAPAPPGLEVDEGPS